MRNIIQKTRKFNHLLQNTDIIEFNTMCKILNEILNSTILIMNKKGKILSYSLNYNNPFTNIKQNFCINSYTNDKLNTIIKTKEFTNCDYESIHCNTLVVPIFVKNIRYATLLACRNEKKFLADDIIICEYAATILSIEISHYEAEENLERHRKISTTKSAIDTLSYSELEAVIHIFDELDSDEGIITASKVADKVGITRSVIVNALRKLASADTIETRSLGMKGTYIKVKNKVLLEELKKLKE